MPVIDLNKRGRQRRITWESFNHGWAVRIADRLNDILPPSFMAVESPRFGQGLEVDVGTFEGESTPARVSENGEPFGGTATLAWAPPAPMCSIAARFPDFFEIRVFQDEDGQRLVGAIELVSPSNKDRPDERAAFVAKCLSYLKDGVSLIVVDTVTTRSSNLHGELMKMLEPEVALAATESSPLYAAAYRPVRRGSEDQIDVWAYSLAVGQLLPTLALRLTGDSFVQVELETTYAETCRRRRLI